MLCLSRKRGESIVINDNIWVMVIDIRGDTVRLGIGAPKEVPVHREEVYRAIQEDGPTRAVSANPPVAEQHVDAEDAAQRPQRQLAQRDADWRTFRVQQQVLRPGDMQIYCRGWCDGYDRGAREGYAEATAEAGDAPVGDLEVAAREVDPTEPDGAEAEVLDAAESVVCTIFGVPGATHDPTYGLTEADQLSAIRLSAERLRDLFRGTTDGLGGKTDGSA